MGDPFGVGMMEVAIVDETLGSFVTFSERDTLADAQQGMVDGEQEYPPTHQTTFSLHERRRIDEARAALNRYTRRLRESFDRIDQDITAREVERDHDYNSRKNALVDRKNAALSTLKQTKGTGSTLWRDRSSACAEATRNYQEQEFRAGRPPRINFATPLFGHQLPSLGWLTTYVLILSILALLEMPINEVGVRVAFEFNSPTSYIVALFIGVTFVMLAHFLGILLNRALYRQARRRFLSIMGAILVLVMALTMIFVLYKMRGQVTELSSTGLSANQLLNLPGVSTQSGGNWWSGLLQGLLNILPWTGPNDAGSARYAQFGLLLLNVMVFLTGTLFSVGRHDPDIDLEHAWSNHQTAIRKKSALESRYEKHQAEIEADFSAQMVVVQRRVDTLAAEITTLKAERERLLRQATNDMRLVLDALTMQISAYQKGNQQTRKSRVPAYFGHAGLLTLGDNLDIR